MKRKYVPDLSRQMAICETNYARIMKLMPDLDRRDVRNFQISWQNHQAELEIRVDERFRYTSTVVVRHRFASDLPWLAAPAMVVRLYHDAAMAEVVCLQRKQLSGAYPYPNRQMHQPDEKNQLNQHLGEWLSECLQHGHCAEPVFSG